ncbi:MAG TPA: Ig-like domain-containing protein [Nocardioides sp.]|uniref:Ig-like domain-containing protein n=1 Tax=uncultured Nocardioides sp. TaxID=198441 RepID=UPI000EE510BE|nr:Ig-like domain-containing protein [uncultured Nocardioides sp.]HCB05745.1 hypothetical protein [Nocardioides sp.]HRI97720.1 Ig-like domain-containing protein [Nocardioides sp.]HRK47246.1 Ig-like domain-containing protein [Nocardioides sp.]
MRTLGVALALTLGLTLLGVVTATPAVAAPPDNNNLANAEVISEPGIVQADTTEATRESGESTKIPADCRPIGLTTVWYAYTATSSDVLRVDTLSDDPEVDTVVGIYTSSNEAAPTIASLTSQRCNDQVGDGNLSNVQIRMTEGKVYFIQVANYNGTAPGPVQLSLTVGPPPANDDVAGADVIDALVPGWPVHPTTDMATRQTSEPLGCPAVSSSVWYRWRPDATVSADIEATELDPEMATAVNVYTGPGLTNPTCGGTDVQFTTQPGQTYYVQVADSGTQSVHGRPGARDVVLTISPPPANDDLADALPIDSPSRTAINNTFADVQAGEPDCGTADPVTRTLWYTYTPDADGTLLVETNSAQAVDTMVAVYTGSSIGTLDERACDDDSGPGLLSKLTVPVTAGTTYLIQTGTFGAKGTFDLRLGSGTSTELTSSATDQTVRLEAAVEAISGDPTGTVRFFDGAVSKGTAPLVAGTATLTLSGVAGGQHDYHAEFEPADSDYLFSESAIDSVTVTAPPPPPAPVTTETTVLAPAKVFAGRRAKVRVLVTTDTGSTATGTITVTIGKRTKTVQLVNGRATVKSSRLRKTGKVAVLATYTATSTALASSDTAKIKVRTRRNT